MREIVRNWTPKTEFFFVAIVAFAIPIVGSLAYLSPEETLHYSSAGLWSTAIIEILTLGGLGSLLHIRDWSLRDIGCEPSGRLTVLGIVLFAVSYPTCLLITGIVGRFVPAADQRLSSLVAEGLSVPAVVALSVVNPVYEEILVLGYVFTAFEKISNSSTAFAVSVAIRTSYHLYEGPAGAVGVLAVGLIFTFFFYKRRQLWPVVVAHGLWDLWALLGGP